MSPTTETTKLSGSRTATDKLLHMTTSGRISTKFSTNTGERSKPCRARREHVIKLPSISGSNFKVLECLYDRASKVSMNARANRSGSVMKVASPLQRAASQRNRRYGERTTDRLIKAVGRLPAIFFNMFKQQEVEDANMDRKTRKHFDAYIQSSRTTRLNTFGELWRDALDGIDRLAIQLFSFVNATAESETQSCDRAQTPDVHDELLNVLQQMRAIMHDLVGLMPSELHSRNWKTAKLARLCHVLKLSARYPVARELNVITSEILNYMLTPPVSIDSDEDLQVADLREMMKSMRIRLLSWQSQGNFGDSAAIQDAISKLTDYHDALQSFSKTYPHHSLAWYWNIDDLRIWIKWITQSAKKPEEKRLREKFRSCCEVVLQSRKNYNARCQKRSHRVLAHAIPHLNMGIHYQIWENAGDTDKLEDIEDHVEHVFDELKILKDTIRGWSDEQTKKLLQSINICDLEQFDEYLEYAEDDDSWNIPVLRESGRLAEMYASKSKYSHLRTMVQFILEAIREVTPHPADQPIALSAGLSPTLSLRDSLSAIYGNPSLTSGPTT